MPDWPDVANAENEKLRRCRLSRVTAKAIQTIPGWFQEVSEHGMGPTWISPDRYWARRAISA